MLSRGGLYALQASLLLAQREAEGWISAARMAEELEVPREYLAKILGRLKGHGIVTSTRGTRGGYRLAHRPEVLTVEDVVHAFEQPRPLQRCLLGGTCDLDNPCPAHRRRLEWNQARARIFRATKLTDLLPEPAAVRTGTGSTQPFYSKDRT